MSKYAGSVLINLPIGKVWDFIANPLNAPIWAYGVLSIEITSPGQIGVGSTFSLVLRGYKMKVRVAELQVDKKIVLEFTDGPVQGSYLTYAVESVGDRTKLTRDLDMKLRGIWKLTRPILAYRELRDREMGVNDVKRIMESSAVPAYVLF